MTSLQIRETISTWRKKINMTQDKTVSMTFSTGAFQFAFQSWSSVFKQFLFNFLPRRHEVRHSWPFPIFNLFFFWLVLFFFFIYLANVLLRFLTLFLLLLQHFDFVATFSYILHGLVIWSIQGSVTDVIALNKFDPLSCSAGQKSDACVSISKDSPFYLHNGKWDYQF